jgi:lipid A 3-O-deacylase
VGTKRKDTANANQSPAPSLVKDHGGLSQTHHSWECIASLAWVSGLLLAVSVAWGGSFCWAESDAPSPDTREILKRGTIEAGGTVGFWQALLFPSEEHSTNRSAVFIMPRIGMVVSDEVQAGALTGNLEVLVEPFFAQFTQPFSAEAAGGALVFKYNLLSFGRWVPFWDAGVGMIWTNLAPRIPEESTLFNFALETGPGAQYFMTSRMARPSASDTATSRTPAQVSGIWGWTPYFPMREFPGSCPGNKSPSPAFSSFS